MIKIDRNEGRFIVSGEATDIVTDIAMAISLLVENSPADMRLDMASMIYKLVTEEQSPLWKGTGVTVGEIKERLEDAEKRSGSFEDFLGRRFTRGEI